MPQGVYPRQSLNNRFWSKVAVKSPDKCWEWTAGKTYQGYGAFWINGRTLPAHRVSWELQRGLIPPGICVLHHCDNPGCVNPHHLFLGTQADNIADRDSKGHCRAPKGEDNGRSKLTKEEVLEIRRSSLNPKELAKQYKISWRQIRSILNRVDWAWL